MSISALLYVQRMLQRVGVPILHTDGAGSYRDYIRRPGCLEAERGYRHADRSLQGLQLAARADIDGEGDKEHAHNGPGSFYYGNDISRIYCH